MASSLSSREKGQWGKEKLNPVQTPTYPSRSTWTSPPLWSLPWWHWGVRPSSLQYQHWGLVTVILHRTIYLSLSSSRFSSPESNIKVAQDEWRTPNQKFLAMVLIMMLEISMYCTRTPSPWTLSLKSHWMHMIEHRRRVEIFRSPSSWYKGKLFSSLSCYPPQVMLVPGECGTLLWSRLRESL